MAKYKVIALSCGGLRNKIFNVGDIVTDKNFREGRAAELVKQKFLEEIPEDGESAETSVETTPAGTPAGVEGAELNLDADDSSKTEGADSAETEKKDDEATETSSEENAEAGTSESAIEHTTSANDGSSTEDKDAEVKILSIDEVTTTLLKNELKDAKISFGKNASKEELYQLWVALKEGK